MNLSSQAIIQTHAEWMPLPPAEEQSADVLCQSVGTTATGLSRVPLSLRAEQVSGSCAPMYSIPVCDSLGSRTVGCEIDSIKRLISANRIDDAREACRAQLQCCPWDDALLRLMHLLQPPMIRAVNTRGRDTRSDAAWIQSHLHDYAGQWVALADGQLVASSANLKDLLSKVRSLGVEMPLVHKMPLQVTSNAEC